MKRSMIKSIGFLLLVTVLILFLLPAAWAAKDGSGVNRVTTDGNKIAKDNNEAYISGISQIPRLVLWRLPLMPTVLCCSQKMMPMKQTTKAINTYYQSVKMRIA